jgi:hypothetical protein
MSYTATETRTKPANVQWFGESNNDSARRANALPREITGFISKQKVRVDENTIVRTYVFDTKANFIAYLSARSSNPDEAARIAYNTANGITTTLAQ